MISHSTEIRVRYADTDKMQFVYNGKYLEYFEVGRTELLRSLNLPYSEVEKSGYQLPLLEANLKFISAAVYDDIIIVTAKVTVLYSPKVLINYTIKRKETEELIAEGSTTHIFINSQTKKAVRPPKIYIDTLAPFFK
ncbi:MAG: acyl-CoA thioesterase [Ignavibacteria bacterium]|nr:acyl-CoA thioesterase [Ignavibacteria bacterium]